MKTKLNFLFFVVGPTNAGKTTFLETVHRDYPGGVHLVQVGKIMRAKYPPEHFKGGCNPAHTAKEALELCKEGILEGLKNNERVILVDGQPRDPEQAKALRDWKASPDLQLLLATHYHIGVIELICPREERMLRAQKRDGDDPEKLKLSLVRMNGDVLALYETLIHFTPFPVYRFNTNDPDYDPFYVFHNLTHSIADLLMS